MQFALLALQALARPGSATWSERGFLGAFAEVRFGRLDEAPAASARVLAPGTAHPIMPLPFVLGLQATAEWLSAKRRRALRTTWRRAGLLEEWRAAAGELVVRYDAGSVRAWK